MKAFLNNMLIHTHYFVRTLLGIERPIQQVLYVVIENGFYTPESTRHSSSFMCHALARAYTKKYITEAELEHTRKKIRQYLHKVDTLEDYLCLKNLPFDFASRRQIYQNWEARP